MTDWSKPGEPMAPDGEQKMEWRASVDRVERLSLEPGEVLAVIVKDANAPVAHSVQTGLAELLGVPSDRVVIIRGDVELRVFQKGDADE